MLDNSYSIQNYMKEIEPIVSEFQEEKEIISQFESNLIQLKREALFCNDYLTIYQSWQDKIGREIQGDYIDNDLLELHGYSDATLTQNGKWYKISNAGQDKIEFYLCEHKIYTPIYTEKNTHQCLKC